MIYKEEAEKERRSSTLKSFCKIRYYTRPFARHGGGYKICTN